MIRHWNAWDEGKRSHLFVADATTGEAKDLTPKLEVNTPPAPFGGSNDYAFSPDGKELAFTAEPLKDLAWSTNTDIWTVPVEGGEPKNLTEKNQGADAQPAYSPDGKRLAYVSQARAGFESDHWVLKVRDRESGTTLDVSSHLDRPVQSFAWEDANGAPGGDRQRGNRADRHAGRAPATGTTQPAMAGHRRGRQHVGPGRARTASRWSSSGATPRRPGEVYRWHEGDGSRPR